MIRLVYCSDTKSNEKGLIFKSFLYVLTQLLTQFSVQNGYQMVLYVIVKFVKNVEKWGMVFIWYGVHVLSL